MKVYIFVFLCFVNVFSCLYAQENHQSFIREITRVYNNKQHQFQRESEKVMKNLKPKEEWGEWEKSEQYDFLFMPQLLLRKSRILYKDIDSTNLVQYFNPRSMFYHEAFVSIDSQFVGSILDSNLRGIGKEFRPKPKTDNSMSERLFKQLIAINPDIVFSVRNIGYYFFIKDSRLFVLDREEDTEGIFLIFSIEEYIERDKEFIFDVFFRYVPRMRYVKACC